MATITQLSDELQTLLTETADELAQQTGFVKRKRSVSGAAFAQGLVFGLMDEPNATRHQLHIAYSRNSAKPISAEGFDQRFTFEAVTFLKSMVETAMQIGLKTQLGNGFGVLSQFNGVYILDGTKMRLNDGQTHLLTRLNLSDGTITWEQTEQKQHENRFALTHAPLPVGALRLADLGFFHLDTFAQLSHDGIYWLSRYKSKTSLYDADGHRLDLQACLGQQTLDCAVWVGQHRLPARLVARPVPAQVAEERQHQHRRTAHRKQQSVSQTVLDLSRWTIYLTNIAHLDGEALDALARARWQIERVFKLWKSFFRLPQLASRHPLRRLCLFWAKLLTILLAHWLMALDHRAFPQRSLWQTAQVVQSFAVSIFDALADPSALPAVLRHFQATLARVARLSKRGAHPLSFQLLA